MKLPAILGHFRRSLSNIEDVLKLSTKPNGRIVLNSDDLVATSDAMKKASVNNGPAIANALEPIADEARLRALDHLLSQPPQGDGSVVLTAGGPGSGKSTTAPERPSAGFTFDSVLKDRAWAEQTINRILASGRRVEIQFVARDPAEAMRGNLERALTAKRLLSADRLAQLHVDARQTLHDLANRYSGNPNVQFTVRHNRENAPAKDIAPQDVPFNAAVAEAKRRGVPLHEIIPVN